ncbi:MAG: hypothetical protein EOO06_07475 [Chitinophagaceae bacterium]|nr:MAG: hypothetical protein EOO06_07475 [Chitinophagaceae bacterium]
MTDNNNTLTPLGEKMTDARKMIEDKTGVPVKYLVAGAIAIAAVSLLAGKKKKSYAVRRPEAKKPGFFRQYITPLIVAAAYKKLTEVVEHSLRQREAQQPAPQKASATPALLP